MTVSNLGQEEANKKLIDEMLAYDQQMDYDRQLALAIEKSKEVSGIPNMGNTCYMNSLLQAILPLQKFGDFMYEVHCHFEENKNKQTNLEPKDEENEEAMKKLLEVYATLNKSEKNFKVIEKFYEYLCENFTQFYEQEDSHILLLYLLKIVNKFIQRKNSGKHSEEEKKEKNDLENESMENMHKLRRNPSPEPSESLPLVNPFTGVYKNVFECKTCNESQWESDDSRDTLSISCSLPTVKNNLKDMFNSEDINGYPCFRCTLIENQKKCKDIVVEGDPSDYYKELLFHQSDFIEKYLKEHKTYGKLCLKLNYSFFFS